MVRLKMVYDVSLEGVCQNNAGFLAHKLAKHPPPTEAYKPHLEAWKSPIATSVPKTTHSPTVMSA
jgi:hypothetical protein